MKLLIYSEFYSPRLQFIIHQVMGVWYRWEFEIISDLEKYKLFEGVSLNYSKCRIKKKELYVYSSDLLSKSGITSLNESFDKYIKIPAFFNSEELTTEFQDDVLGFIFLLLSRYEEYLPYDPDVHGRFTARLSWAFKDGYLQYPIVDHWVQALYLAFNSIFPGIPPLKRNFQKQLTYDIDMAWAYLNKGAVRSMGSVLQDIRHLRWSNLNNKLSVWKKQAADPYNTFPLLDRWHTKFGYKPRYFFLLGKWNQFDKNISPENQSFKALIQQIAANYYIGIHPSYLSNSQESQLEMEIKSLVSISQQPIYHSRQHFLKLHLPQTYRRLLQCGIKHDYSMGYADAIGFRAGTCFPFYWYDLEKEEATDLLIHPFQIMDITLKEYLHLNPTQAKEEIREIIDSVKDVHGTFCSLWHNSSFSYLGDWQDWKEVYEYLLEYGN